MGTTDEAGEQLVASAIRAGLGLATYVHGVGDGAAWIAAQIDQRFRDPGRYLLDFYHLCEYLADASSSCAPEDSYGWLEQQKRRLKRNHVAAVLKALHPYLEPSSVLDKTAPVRAAYRYIHNQLQQLDYKGALAAELPIGSGEIESAHRYVIQQRLKRERQLVECRKCLGHVSTASDAGQPRLAVLLVRTRSKRRLTSSATFNCTQVWVCVGQGPECST